MARILVDCADPSDFSAITEAVEKAAGRCNITYAKQAAALVEAGTVKSERAAAKQISEETGESVNTVRSMIKRGKSEMNPAPEVDATASTRHTIVDGKVYDGIRYGEMAIAQLERIEADDPKREEALRKVIAWAQHQLDANGAIDQEASLPPAKSERREKALEVLKPLAEKAIMDAIGTGLDKTLHLNDSFAAAYSTGAGAGRVVVVEVVVKKITGT